MFESKVLDGFLEKDFEWRDYVNVIKPEILSSIAEYVRNSGADKPLEQLQVEVEGQRPSLKRDLVLNAIRELKVLKEQYSKGDRVSRMRLVNYGLIRRKKHGS